MSALTNLDRLILAQAVYELGANSWSAVAKLLTKHPLLSRHKSFFTPQSCHAIYNQLMKEADLECTEANNTLHAPSNLKLAQRHYQARMLELKDLLLVEETKFKQIISEIDEIRSGHWDDTISARIKGILTSRGFPSSDPRRPHIRDKPKEEIQQADEVPGSNLTDPGSPSSPSKVTVKTREPSIPAPSGTDVQPDKSSIPAGDYYKVADSTRTLGNAETESSIPRHAPDLPPTRRFHVGPFPVAEGLLPEHRQAKGDREEEEPLQDSISAANGSAIRESHDHPNMTASSSTLGLEVAPDYPRPISFQSFRLDEDDHVSSTTADDTPLRRREGKRKTSDGSESIRDKKRVREESEPGDDDDAGPGQSSRRRERLAPTGEQVASKKFQTVINLIHSQISQHRSGNIFHNPIKRSEAPDYYDIVKRPMDLKTIKTRIRDGVISNSAEFQRDVFLMFANAMMFNRPGSDIYDMAEDMMLESENQINTYRTTEVTHRS